MRSDGFRRWRPLLGVAALGIFAFGWSMQGAAEEKLRVAPMGESASAVVSVPEELTPVTDAGPGLAAERSVVAGSVDNVLTGVPVSARLPAFGASGFEPSIVKAGTRQGECICDLDCADGDPCTNDWCDIETTPGEGQCVQDYDGTDTRDCDDTEDPANVDYCLLGSCDGAGACVADDGGSPCADDEYCNEGLDRCEDAGCAGGSGCDDGQFCNGSEICDAENQCVLDKNCSVTTGTSCTEDAECPAGEVCTGDPCYGLLCDEDGDACGAAILGRCCTGAGGYETCTENGTIQACDALGGNFEYGGHCDCPKYSSGWAPAGTWFYDLAPIQEQPCTEYFRLGDDYTLGNGEYLELEEFKFVGGVDPVDDGRVVFEFWDNSVPPIKIDEIRLNFAAGDPISMWTVTLGETFIIPPTGYVTFKMRDGSLAEGHWYSTDEVDVGSNNPALLWVNDVLGPHLSPDDPDVLSFELFGTKVDEPLYACCDPVGGTCSLALPWICEADGGISLLGVLSCDPDPCTTGACCITATGVCDDTYLSQALCEGDGGEWQGYGTDCVPNCCEQPLVTGGDNCDDCIVQEIVVPAFGAPAVEITLSGDSTTASLPDEPEFGCATSEGDLGWFEAFNLVSSPGGPAAECAKVTIDECCTVPNHPSSYVIVLRECSEAAEDCGNSVRATDYGWSPFCGSGDENMWTLFDNLPGGLYHYPIVAFCDEDPVGYCHPYQVHITVEACDEAACCLPPDPSCPSVCVNTNRIACDAAQGWFLADTPFCLPGNANCVDGACCTGPGICEDDGGAGMSCADCLAASGDFFGGARCVDDPCPICPWSIYGDNCLFNVDGDYFRYTDRSDDDPRWADDFVAGSDGPLERICWIPCFFDPTNNEECYENPPITVQNSFVLTMYNDNGGLPGSVIYGPVNLVPDAQAWVGQEIEYNRCWDYSAPIVGGPVLVTGVKYWFEISGFGEPDGCQVGLLSHCEGNQYSVSDSDGTWGPEDVFFLMGGGSTTSPYSECIDIALCSNITLPAGAGGDVPGACIECGEEGPECRDTVHHNDAGTGCRGDWGPTNPEDGVAFYPGQDCGEITTPPPPPNDICEGHAIDLHAPGDLCETLPCTVPFENYCANTDGPDPECGTQFRSDIWYEYHTQAGECGWLTLDTCVNGTYDGIMAVYYNGGGTCACPTDSTNMLDCGDDTCGVGGGMPLIEDLYVYENKCYLIRVGGWADRQGSGELVITFEADPAGCETTAAQRPMPENCASIAPGNRCSASPTCLSDADCAFQSICVQPPPGDPPGGICYAPKSRYLSLAANPAVTGPTAMRVKLDDGTLIGWVGEPTWAAPTGQHDGLWLSGISATPYYGDPWPDVVHVRAWQISHAALCDDSDGSHCGPNNCPGGAGETCYHHMYEIQAINGGSDIFDEGNYSIALTLNTPSVWGDTVSTCAGNVCKPPNGVVGLDDVQAAIKYYQNNRVAPITWLDIDPSNGSQVPNQNIGIGDILKVIDGFQGKPYPGDGPV